MAVPRLEQSLPGFLSGDPVTAAVRDHVDATCTEGHSESTGCRARALDAAA